MCIQLRDGACCRPRKALRRQHVPDDDLRQHEQPATPSPCTPLATVRTNMFGANAAMSETNRSVRADERADASNLVGWPLNMESHLRPRGRSAADWVDLLSRHKHSVGLHLSR